MQNDSYTKMARQRLTTRITKNIYGELSDDINLRVSLICQNNVTAD